MFACPVSVIVVYMYTRRFFLISLGIPLAFLLFGVLIVVFSVPEIPEHLGDIVVPYLSFFLFFLLWVFHQTPRQIRYAAYRAPLVFLAFQISYLVLEFSMGVSIAKDIVGLSSIIVIISTYAILLGYLYVFLMEQGYLSYLFYMRHHHLERIRARKKVRARSI